MVKTNTPTGCMSKSPGCDFLELVTLIGVEEEDGCPAIPPKDIE
jgi:hypothetical protein